MVNKNLHLQIYIFVIRYKSADKCCFNIKPEFRVRFRKPSVRRVSAQEVGVPAVLAQFDHHVVEDVPRLVMVVRVERLYPACDKNKNKKKTNHLHVLVQPPSRHLRVSLTRVVV